MGAIDSLLVHANPFSAKQRKQLGTLVERAVQGDSKGSLARLEHIANARGEDKLFLASRNKALASLKRPLAQEDSGVAAILAKPSGTAAKPAAEAAKPAAEAAKPAAEAAKPAAEAAKPAGQVQAVAKPAAQAVEGNWRNAVAAARAAYGRGEKNAALQAFGSALEFARHREGILEVIAAAADCGYKEWPSAYEKALGHCGEWRQAVDISRLANGRGQSAMAEKALDKATALPGDWQDALSIARTAHGQGQQNAAARAMGAAQGRASSTPEALAVAATGSELGFKSWDVVYQKAIEKADGWRQAVDVARAAHGRGQSTMAEKALDKAVALSSTWEDALSIARTAHGEGEQNACARALGSAEGRVRTPQEALAVAATASDLGFSSWDAIYKKAITVPGSWKDALDVARSANGRGQSTAACLAFGAALERATTSAQALEIGKVAESLGFKMPGAFTRAAVLP